METAIARANEIAFIVREQLLDKFVTTESKLQLFNMMVTSFCCLLITKQILRNALQPLTIIYGNEVRYILGRLEDLELLFPLSKAQLQIRDILFEFDKFQSV